jgi:methionyl aminopeptidase
MSVKLDVTLELDGFMADSAVTVVLPPVSVEARALQRAARIAFNRGLAVARAGTSLREVGRAVESAARREGAVVVRELTGHGIGAAFTSRRVCLTGPILRRAPSSRKGW